MQASKELENDFLDPLVDGYKFSCEAAFDPQEMQWHRGRVKHANSKVHTQHSDRAR